MRQKVLSSGPDQHGHDDAVEGVSGSALQFARGLAGQPVADQLESIRPSPPVQLKRNDGPESSKEEDGGGVKGWLRSTGSCFADKYDETTETVGDFANKTGRAAKELWDIASHSDVSLSGGKLVVNTDLAELMDVMPADVRAALSLGQAEAASRVEAVIDPIGKTAVLTSDEIVLSGLNTARLQTGGVTLRGVRLTCSNPGGGIPFLGDDFSFLGFQDSDDNLQFDLEVSGVTAEDVTFNGADGVTKISRLEVNDLSGQLAAEGGAPLSEAAQTSLGFSVEGAVLEGLVQQGVSVDRLEATDVSGGMDGGEETAFLAADGFNVQGGAKGGQTIGDASASGARIDVDNKGGGLVGLDDKEDNLSGRVKVSTASISDFAGASASLEEGLLSNAAVDFDSAQGSAEASVEEAAIRGMDGAVVGVDQAKLTDVGASLDTSGEMTRLRGWSDTANISGVTFDGGGARDEASESSFGLDWGVGVRDVNIEDVDVAGTKVGRLTGTDLQTEGIADRVDSRFTAQAGSIGLTDVNNSSFSTDSGRVDTAHIDWSAADGARFRAARAEASGLNSAGFSAEQLTANHADARVPLGEGGEVSLGQLSGEGLTVADRVNLAKAEASDVNLEFSPERKAVTVGTAKASDVSDVTSGVHVDNAELSSASAVSQGSRLDATLSRGQVSGVTADGASVGSLSVADVAMSHLAGENGESFSGTLSIGHRGAEVEQLQRLLQSKQLYTSAVDGHFGQGTKAAVIAFQRSAGLSVDGVAGPSTLRALQGAGGTQAAFGSLAAEDVKLRGPSGSVSADGIRASGGRAQLGGGNAASLDQVNVSNATFSATGGGGGAAVDTDALIRSGSRLVDDADIRASLDLPGGKLGPLKVRDNTTASANLVVRDNQVDTKNTSVDLSRPVDGPVWTSVRGVYGTDDNRLKAKVGGWFDQDVGGRLNTALGLEGKALHSVATMGEAATRLPAGDGGSTPDLLNGLNVDGSVSLSGGTLDAGRAGSLSLAERERAAQNRVEVSTDDRGQVVAGVADLLSRGFTANTEAGKVSGGATRVNQAEVAIGADGAAGTVEALELQELLLNGGVTSEELSRLKRLQEGSP